MFSTLFRLARTTPVLVATGLAAVACGFEEGEFGASDTLLVPSDIELQWDGSFNASEDGLGAVVPVDVMVYDGTTGDPRYDVAVELGAGPDTYLLGESELRRVDAEGCATCALFWDAWHDQYYALESGIVPGPTRVRTDDEGIARVFVLIDALDVRLDAYAPVTVQVETPHAEGSFLIIPQ